MNANMLATYYYVLDVTAIMLITCIVIALPNNALTKHYTYKKKHIHSLIDCSAGPTLKIPQRAQKTYLCVR